MFLTRSEYDRGVNTFSPEGRLFQVEYAIEAIKLGSTAIGIQTSAGVVLAAEKRVTSPLMITSSIEKLVQVDKFIGLWMAGLIVYLIGFQWAFPLALLTSIKEVADILVLTSRTCSYKGAQRGCAVSGLMADSRTLIDKARVEAAYHWFNYNERMAVESVAQAVSNLAIRFGDSDAEEGPAMSRPFGVAMLFAGIDDDVGPVLYHMDPSGTYVQYLAKAIGSGSEGAQQSLEEAYNKSMTMKEALKSALTILKQVMEERLDASNVEVASVTQEQGYHFHTKEEVEEILKEVQ